MNLVDRRSEIDIGGVVYRGLPYLLDCEERIVEAALLFLVHVGIEGRAGSERSWATYGRHLYDYFGFLEEHGLGWDTPQVRGGVLPIVQYRNWSIDHGLDRRVINSRLRTVLRLYQWAVEQRLIERLPYPQAKLLVPNRGFRVRTGRAQSASSPLLLRESEKVVQILSAEQIKALVQAATNPTHYAITRLALGSGLRAEELTTFPRKYLRNTSGLNRRIARIEVHCDPRDMRLKGGKERTIHVPVAVMNDLWRYAVAHRPVLARLSEVEFPVLFLNKAGRPFVANGLVSIYTRLAKSLGFKVNAHLLRHTYATRTLYAAERAKKQGRFRGDPLDYVRQRLGHAWLETTMIYAHLIDELDALVLVDEYQSEIDAACPSGK